MDRMPLVGDDENEFEEFDHDEYFDKELRPVDLTRFVRDEDHIYESIEEEIGLDEVLRELPDFEVEIDIEDLSNDALGG